MKFATKLVALLVGLVLFTSIAVFFPIYSASIEILEEKIIGEFEGRAVQTIDKLDRTLYERRADIQVMSTDNIIASRDSTPKEITERLIFYRDIYKTYSSITLFDLNRVRVAGTTGIGLGGQHSASGYWRDVARGEDSPIGFYRSEQLDDTMLYFAAKVRDENNEAFGLVVSRVPLARLFEIISDVAKGDGKEIEESILIDLIDSDGLILFSNHNQRGILTENIFFTYPSEIQFVEGESRGSRHTHDEIPYMAVFAREQGHLDFEGNDWVLLVHIPEEVVFGLVFELRNQVLLVLLIVLIISVSATWFFARSLSEPLKQLHDATEKVEQGDFSTRVNIGTGDEMEQLGNAFNKTTSALDKMESQRKQLEKAKTEFLSITSHELRSPMTPMRAQLQMLLEGYFGKIPRKQRDSLEIILRNTTRLDKIIFDFLEISRIEAARLKFNFVHASLTAPVQDLVKEMDAFLPEKQIKLNLQVGKLPKIEVDPDRAMQVLRNIVNNAKKFSPPKSTITIKAELKRSGIAFSVKDQGAGILPENLARVFEPFFQEEQTIYRKFRGTGLGLTICRGIIESQGGKIWVESEKGKGSTFYFTVPLKPVREILPIKLLFSPKEDVEKKIRQVFVEYLGALGDEEFEQIRVKGLRYKSLSDYVAELQSSGVLSDEQAGEILSRIRKIFETEKPAEPAKKAEENKAGKGKPKKSKGVGNEA